MYNWLCGQHNGTSKWKESQGDAWHSEGHDRMSKQHLQLVQILQLTARNEQAHDIMVNFTMSHEKANNDKILLLKYSHGNERNMVQV